ncbi:hypothetical protein G6F70_005918 [Rhizopus microsporus]|nr:hypothetical protein G6F71_005864 [Rhizopus microsporus]KAG1198308.1 hypothetical protein G6F70_005918 [Rhizopus microsporus]KAG1210013.1 hypothetical protein G6F69_005848 [Rhizopus microsporus]KAG1230220.1 hypothetical protein G6F67_006617 [Rhizopus microsporus]KAG1262276.1 hypothetical protein G6F68_006046 [Rhizopus microsporus]
MSPTSKTRISTRFALRDLSALANISTEHLLKLNEALGSKKHNTRIKEGIALADDTIVKGYPSLPIGTQIVRLKLERIPLQLVKKLTKAMETQPSCFGVDYAILNIDPKSSPGNILEILNRLTRSCRRLLLRGKNTRYIRNLAQLRGEMAGYLKARSAGDDAAIDEALTKMERTKRQIVAIQECSSVFKSMNLRTGVKTSSRSDLTLSHRDLPKFQFVSSYRWNLTKCVIMDNHS